MWLPDSYSNRAFKISMLRLAATRDASLFSCCKSEHYFCVTKILIFNQFKHF
nr:MAG TPA: hypothetical protein [Caudoviricetes sp.]